jgi:hypothetical protein
MSHPSEVRERRFWDGHRVTDAEFVLKRHPTKAGSFTIEQPFIYADPVRGDFIVPKVGLDPPFVTDLASVPLVTSWLVPKDGTHTPAALVHDALIRKKDEPIVHDGPEVSRHEADRIFLEAMAHLEVPYLRRWMMWSAVTIATLVTPGEGRAHWYWRTVLSVVLAALFAVGFTSVLDLVDLHEIRVPLVGWAVSTSLPWMGDERASTEVLGGFVAAVVAAFVTPLLWLRWWKAGLVAALVLIPFAFPLLIATVAYAAYFVVELLVYEWQRLRYEPASDASPPAQPKLLKNLAD